MDEIQEFATLEEALTAFAALSENERGEFLYRLKQDILRKFPKKNKEIFKIKYTEETKNIIEISKGG